MKRARERLFGSEVTLVIKSKSYFRGTSVILILEMGNHFYKFLAGFTRTVHGIEILTRTVSASVLVLEIEAPYSLATHVTYRHQVCIPCSSIPCSQILHQISMHSVVLLIYPRISVYAVRAKLSITHGQLERCPFTFASFSSDDFRLRLEQGQSVRYASATRANQPPASI